MNCFKDIWLQVSYDQVTKHYNLQLSKSKQDSQLLSIESNDIFLLAIVHFFELIRKSGYSSVAMISSIYRYKLFQKWIVPFFIETFENSISYWLKKRLTSTKKGNSWRNDNYSNNTKHTQIPNSQIKRILNRLVVCGF